MAAISTVTAGNPVKASDINAIVNVVNALMGRQIFTASGTFTVPANVNKLRVRLCSKGGDGGTGRDEGPDTVGGTSPMVEKILTGIDPGSSIAVTISSTLTSFGTYMTSTHGTNGTTNNSGQNGEDGTASGYDIMISNRTYCAYLNMGCGEGATSSGAAGGYAICVVEW